MTATPRIYAENIKDKADEVSAEVTSMDDETVYGPEFHRLSFGDAVERGLLTDYKVVVLVPSGGLECEALVLQLLCAIAVAQSGVRDEGLYQLCPGNRGHGKRIGRAPGEPDR